MSRRWIQYPHREGTISRQAHADFPAEAPYEREAGRSGFFGPTAHFHHKRPPTSWTRWEGELRPRAYDLMALPPGEISPWSAPALLSNAAVQYRLWRLETPMTALDRNPEGDDLLFVHAGGGALFCDYGHLELEQGDYVVIPRGTMWRLEPSSPMTLLMIEATNDSYQLPDKGLVGPQAIFDPAMLDVPAIDEAFLAQQTDEPWTVEIKRLGRMSRVHYDYSPLDAIGWHGDLAVSRLNWRHIRPLMSHRYHLPPSAHTTFVAGRFVICSFVPRPIESDPGALKVPFFHNNDDFDEVIFYHAGDFFSRDNIEPGTITWHPSGFTHGPHPKALAAGQASAKTFTEEVAVMLDTRDPLQASDALSPVELPAYADSWRAG